MISKRTVFNYTSCKTKVEKLINRNGNDQFYNQKDRICERTKLIGKKYINIYVVAIKFKLQESQCIKESENLKSISRRVFKIVNFFSFWLFLRKCTTTRISLLSIFLTTISASLIP